MEQSEGSWRLCPAASRPKERRQLRRGDSGVLIVRAAILCCALTIAGTTVFGQGASQPPAPSRAKASSPQQANTAKPDSDAERPKSDAGHPPTVNVYGRQEAQATADQKPNQGHEESSWKGVWEALIALGSVALAVITGVLALYTYRLWREAVKARKAAIADGIEARKETREALDIARQAADASKNSADAALASERAYVFGEMKLQGTLEPEPHQMPTNCSAEIRFANHGKTPADVEEIRVYHTRIAISPDTPADAAAYTERIGQQPQLPPGRVIGEPYVFLYKFNIGHRRDTINIVARIAYRDVFGGKRHTQIVYQTVTPAAFIPSLVVSLPEDPLNEST